MCSTSTTVVVRVQEAINDAPIWVLPPSSNFSIDVLEVGRVLMLVLILPIITVIVRVRLAINDAPHLGVASQQQLFRGFVLGGPVV